MYYPTHYKKHRAHFAAMTPAYVNGQGREMFSKVPFGLKTVGEAGCGPMALYNAVTYVGKKADMPKILRYLELTATPLFGLFGTFPFSMGYCLRHFGVKNRMTWSRKKLAAARAGVIAFWVRRPIIGGGHFVFYTRTLEGKYLVYNRYSNVSEPVEYNSLDEMMKPCCLIVGYVIR